MASFPGRFLSHPRHGQLESWRTIFSIALSTTLNRITTSLGLLRSKLSHKNSGSTKYSRVHRGVSNPSNITDDEIEEVQAPLQAPGTEFGTIGYKNCSCQPPWIPLGSFSKSLQCPKSTSARFSTPGCISSISFPKENSYHSLPPLTLTSSCQEIPQTLPGIGLPPNQGTNPSLESNSEKPKEPAAQNGVEPPPKNWDFVETIYIYNT